MWNHIVVSVAITCTPLSVLYHIATGTCWYLDLVSLLMSGDTSHMRCEYSHSSSLKPANLHAPFRYEC